MKEKISIIYLVSRFMGIFSLDLHNDEIKEFKVSPLREANILLKEE
ncbi:hypothetical protein UFO1_4593 [Pelosinus sp. UFO1]|nr:hypothetical protein UFO1_4593 [Pelosinus sp. UFO1]